MKKILAMILAAMLLFTLVSCGNKVEDEGHELQDAANENVYVDPVTKDKLTYETDDLGGYVITAFTSATSTAHKVEIPAEIDNVKVTGIGLGAFKLSGYVSEVVISGKVEYIDDFAFYGCTYLTKVTIGDSVTSIGTGAFESCPVLAEVTLSNNIEEISDYLFRNCKALTAITIPEKVVKIGEGAFMACTALTEVKVPAAVKSIGSCAFYGNIALTKATVPASVETFGLYVFNAAAEGFVLVGAEGSAAETYATENEYTFEKLA